MENTSPPRKLPRVAAFGSPKSDAGADAIAERLGNIVEQIGDVANELADVEHLMSASSSPGSVFNDHQDLSEELRGILTKLKLRTEETRPASCDVERPSDISRDEILTVKKGKVIDGMELVTYDNPMFWPPKLRKLYNCHRQHNIKAVQEALGDGVVARRQAYDYFSRQADVICVLDFPPEGETGPMSNLGFSLSELHSKKNDLSVLSVKSVCIRQHALAFCKTAGCYHEGYELVEKKAVDGSSSHIALTPHARDALRCDFIERHPTCIRNDVNLARLISRSSLGRQHVVEGDAIFTAFIKARQEFVRSRNLSNGQGHKLAPVFVWNAGLCRSGDERTGALAALFASLELAGVEELEGMHHPCFLFRKENPLVQLSAASYDRAVCNACRASGRKVDDSSFWQRFIGVADMTPEERLVKERECREFYSALGSLAWMSTGKPGSNKRAVYEEFLAADMGEEQARHLAQAKVLFDGALQAGARRLGMSENELETMTLEERQALVRAMKAADTTRGLLQAALIWASKPQTEVDAMTKEEKRKLLGRYSLDFQLKAAADWDGLSWDDLSQLPEEAKVELVKKFFADSSVEAVAKWAKLSENELEQMSEEAKRTLVQEHKIDYIFRVAARERGSTTEELERFSEEDKLRLMGEHRYSGMVASAARWAEVEPAEISTMTSEEITNMLGRFCIARKEIVACASVGISEDALVEMPRERLAEIARNYDFRGKVKSALKWKNMSETDGASMSEQAHIELVEAHKQFSMLAAACEAFGENVETASTEWADAERAELIQNYNSIRMCEELGFSKAEARQFSAEQRKEVKRTYTKRTLLRRLGILPPEEGDDDDGEEDDEDAEAGEGRAEDLTYEAGMTMTLDELWTMIVMRDGGMTPQQSLRYTCALRLGLSKEQVDGLSQVDLDLARVYSLQRGLQKRNERKGLFLVPGTEAHADLVSEIKSYFKVAGVGVLTDLKNAWGFVDNWAFRKHVNTCTSVANYNVYYLKDFHGIPVWVSHMEDILRTLDLTHKTARQTPSLSRAAISEYIYRRRVDLFSDDLTRESLERMTTHISIGHHSVAERAKLQRRIDKQEQEFSFPGEAIFDSVLEEFSADPSATFQMNAEEREEIDWTSSLCVQRKRYIRSDTGKERFIDFLYYRDDSGAWYGPTVQWGLLAREKVKSSRCANVEMLNEIYARFCERREVDRELIAFEDKSENTVSFYNE